MPSFNLNTFLSFHGFPAQYLWVIPIAMIVLGIPMMFFGREMWKIIVGVGGMVLGYYIASVYLMPHILTYLNQYGIPPYLIEMIVAVMSGVILSIVIRLSITAGIGYTGYYIAMHQTYHPVTTITAIALAVAVFGAAYWAYGKISILIAGALGALVMFFGLVNYLPQTYSAVISVAVLMPGMYYQFHKKYHSSTTRQQRRQARMEAKKAGIIASRNKLKSQLEELKAKALRMSGSGGK